MKHIRSIINTLSEEDQRQFLQRLRRKTKRIDAKNEVLFKHIASGKSKDLDVLLYGKPSKNAYHALCKRLLDNLVDFVALKSFSNETSEELELLKLLLTSRILFEQKESKLAFKILGKAEKRALRVDLFSILNEIYHTKIQYAHLNDGLILADVIAASEKNMKLFRQEQQLNQAYAMIKAEMKINGVRFINKTILSAFSQFKIEVDEALTYKSLLQLMEITTTSARLQRDFYTVSSFMMDIYTIIHKKGELREKHRFYHIKILNLMAVTHFRNKRFRESMAFLRKMEDEMLAESGRYYKRFEEKFLLLTALNHNYTGEPIKAEHILKKIRNPSLDVILVLAMCHFQQQNIEDTYRIIKGLTHSDDWYEKKMDWIWVLKKNMIEILTLIELDRLDLVIQRIERFKRRFSKPLKQIGEERVMKFIQIIERYYENPGLATTEAFANSVENSFEWLEKEQEDIFVMSFYAWLKSKMEKENIYEITLRLVGSE